MDQINDVPISSAFLIADNYGMSGAGDILSRLGKGLCIIAEGERAGNEAEEALRQGQKPH